MSDRILKSSGIDTRQNLLNTPFNELDDKGKRDKKAYKMKLYREKLNENGNSYNEANKIRMRESRAKNKVTDQKILDKEETLRTNNKNLDVLLNKKDKKIEKLEKLTKNLTDKIQIKEIIGTKPSKKTKASPTDKVDNQKAKLRIINLVLTKLYNIQLDTQQTNLFKNLMTKNPSATKQKIDTTFKNLKFLKSDGITQFIQLVEQHYPVSGTSKQYLTVFQYFINILHTMPVFGKPYYEESYYKLNTMTSGQNKIYNSQKKTGQIEKKREGLLFDYNPISTINKLDNFEFKNDTDKLIYAFYTQLPPRRVDDVFNLQIANETDHNKLRSDTNNYIMINKKGVPFHVVYNNSKTQTTYPHQHFDIPTNLSEILKKYIESEKMDFDKRRFIFANKEHNPPSKRSSNFSSRIQKVFNGVYGHLDENGKPKSSTGIGADLVRESSSSFYAKKYALQPDKLEEIAYKQNHSVQKLRDYAKNYTFDTDIEIYKELFESGKPKEKTTKPLKDPKLKKGTV